MKVFGIIELTNRKHAGASKLKRILQVMCVAEDASGFVKCMFCIHNYMYLTACLVNMEFRKDSQNVCINQSSNLLIK